MKSMQRRLEALEAVITPSLEYALLVPREIEEIARRIESGDTFALSELDRLERHSPVICGEILLTCNARKLVLKRCGGIDLMRDL